MGVVWKAWDESVEREVAVKLVLPAHSDEEHIQRLARLERERRVLIELSQHPNVVTLFDILTEPIGYVMEWIEGYDIEAWLEANPGPQPPVVVASIFGPILDAVGYAHERGVVHRDLKPSNVFLQVLGDRVAVRVMDFGLARVVQQESNITTGRLIVGTPQYMAPEQVLGHASTGATDIYTLGILLYEALTGALPVDTGTAESPIPLLLSKVNNDITPPREKCPDLSEELEAVILRATHREPEERYATCADFADALFAAIPNLPRRNSPLIDPATLGVIPPLQSTRLTGGNIGTPKFSDDDLAGLFGVGSTASIQPPESSNGNDVTAVQPAPFPAAARQTPSPGDTSSDTVQADAPSGGRSKNDTLSQDLRHALEGVLHRSKYSKQQLVVGAAVAASAVLLVLLTSFFALTSTAKSSDVTYGLGELPKAYVPSDFNWDLRGSYTSTSVVTEALAEYQHTLHAWNAGDGPQIVARHARQVRCYYNDANMQWNRLPLQPLVRASLGLPLAPFFPEEIFVTSRGRDYVTFIERGLAGELQEPYVRLVQLSRADDAPHWRVNVEASEGAHHCYDNFSSMMDRYKNAGPPSMPHVE